MQFQQIKTWKTIERKTVLFALLQNESNPHFKKQKKIIITVNIEVKHLFIIHDLLYH